MIECRRFAGGTIVLPRERLRLRPGDFFNHGEVIVPLLERYGGGG